MKKKVNKKTTPPEPIEDESILSDKQKDNLLIDLYNSKHWVALKILINGAILQAENTLFNLDAFKYPTEVGRAQGIRIGLYSLETYILKEIKVRKKKEKELDTGVSEDDSLPAY